MAKKTNANPYCCYEDFSDIKNLSVDKIGHTSKLHSAKKPEQNLGLYCNENKLYTSCFCGTTWLKDVAGNVVEDNNGIQQTITVKPRFGLDLNIMIQKIAEDEEFFDYLCNDLPEGERMITFFLKEELIDAQKDELGVNRIIAVLTYIHELYQVTGRKLMKKIIRQEDNFVGKVKGKILFNKQISHNVARGHEERVYCGYVEKSEDVWENQVLKYALIQAVDYLNSGKNMISNAQIETEIKACKLRFNNVAELEEVDAEELDSIQVPAMYSDYEYLFNLAQIVIAEISLDSNMENCSTKIVPYAINMPLLFECYARTLVKESIINKGYSYKMLKFVSDKSKEYGEEYGMKTIDGQYYISGKIVPDIVLVDPKNKTDCVVIDVKYKDMQWKTNEDKKIDLDKKPSRRDDRLQLLAYNQLYQPKCCGHILPRFIVKDTLEEKYTSYHKNIDQNYPPYFMYRICVDDKNKQYIDL